MNVGIKNMNIPNREEFLKGCKEVEIRIKEWETQTTEFKREFSTDPIRTTMAAFANDYAETQE